MDPTARPFQPSKLHPSSLHPAQFNAKAASFAPSVLTLKPTPGWPPSEPPFTDKRWNHLHPSEIPDSVFLDEYRNSELQCQDPFTEDGFQSALTPWWTHWGVAFAHQGTNLDDSAIAKMYKHRYGNVVPGIQFMGAADALELYKYLCDGDHEYAFEWDAGKEGFLRESVLHDLQEAEAYAQETRKQEKVRSAGAKAG